METLIVPGTLDSLKSIGKYVMKAAATADLEKKSAYRLRLAVDEIATNAVIHGYDEAGREGTLRIHTDLNDTSFKIILEDEGGPFDPREIPPPDHTDLPLEERPIGGLGVYLALQGVDEFLYERVGHMNRNTFIVHRNVSLAK